MARRSSKEQRVPGHPGVVRYQGNRWYVAPTREELDAYVRTGSVSREHELFYIHPPERSGRYWTAMIDARPRRSNPRAGANTRMKLRDGTYSLGRVNGYVVFAYFLGKGRGWRVEGDGIARFYAMSLGDAQEKVERLRATRTNPRGRRGRRR